MILRLRRRWVWITAIKVILILTYTSGFVCSSSNPTGNTIIIIQPTSNLDSESPEDQSKPIPLPMPMPPPEPQSPTSANAAGEENPGETLPGSKWLVRATASNYCVPFSSIRCVLYEKPSSCSVLHVCFLSGSVRPLPLHSPITNSSGFQSPQSLTLTAADFLFMLFRTCMSSNRPNALGCRSWLCCISGALFDVIYVHDMMWPSVLYEPDIHWNEFVCFMKENRFWISGIFLLFFVSFIA